jgi:hypothetical protein
MNTNDLNDPVLADFSLHHPRMARRLHRNSQTGCLEYHGPTSRIVGNPLLRRKGKKPAVLMRRFFYEHYKGTIPSGYFVRMRCGSRICHAIRHMMLKDHYGPYISSSNNYLLRYDREILLSIRHYRGKVNKLVLMKAFNIPQNVINGIWTSKSLSSLGSPNRYRPAPEIDALVERLSLKWGSERFLSNKTLCSAQVTIGKSHGSKTLIRVVSMVVSGMTLKRISRKVHRSKGTATYWFRRGLVELMEEFGQQPWMAIISKGRIRQWKASPYKRFQKHAK